MTDQIHVPDYRCYDCGSTIPNHHTPLCDLAPDGAIRDLPAAAGTQWWTGVNPADVEDHQTQT